tara:strand:- start:434 stop:1429 length:996 start_codon:yes stop_codon:yes gene_type:complete
MDSIITKVIKAPAVDNLNSLQTIIKILQFGPIPLSFLDERNLMDQEEAGNITSELHEKIKNWKKTEKIPNTQGLLQSNVSLLKSLEIIDSAIFQEEDLNMPLGMSGPIIGGVLKKTPQAVKLTKIGFDLCTLLDRNDTKSLIEYDNILFWRFLHSNIFHNFQRIIEDSDSYSSDVKGILEKYETDSRSVNYFLNWMRYFDLRSISNNITNSLSKERIAKKIISSVILEINTLEPGTIHGVDPLSNQISKQLDLSKSSINFPRVFEIILTQIKSTDEKKKPIVGSTSSTDELALPNHPKINLLKINDKISINEVILKVPEDELTSVFTLGEE